MSEAEYEREMQIPEEYVALRGEQTPPAPVDPLNAPLWQRTLQSAVLEACRYFTHDEIRRHVAVALAANEQPT